MGSEPRSAAVQESFLRSAASTGGLHSLDDVHRWLEERGRSGGFAVRQVPLAELEDWSFTDAPRRLVHRSGRFFSVEGIRVEASHGPVLHWDQPIVHQPEVGILGIVTRLEEGVRHLLMQAKMEPGNINTLQLSPTVQATRSNYTRAHGGATPHYLEYFTEPGSARVLVDQLQSEQGARFMRKRNRNMVVEVDDLPLVNDDFCWLTLGQIHALLESDNLVNMDARSVLSCISYVAPGDDLALPAEGFGSRILASLASREDGVHSLGELRGWLQEMRARLQISSQAIGLDELQGWECGESSIHHENGRHFSVIGVAVEAGTREVVEWCQPILEHVGVGLVGFVFQEIDGVLHALVRASIEPGNFEGVDMGPTVACSGIEWRQGLGGLPAFCEHFLDPCPERVRYDAIQSEEGGRFYHFQNRYMFVELPEGERIELPGDFVWMTLAQVADFCAQGCFNVEARNLLACIRVGESR